MHTFSGKIILFLVLISFALGGLVVLFKDDYTIAQNVRSNRDYYPSVKIEVPGSGRRPPARRAPAGPTTPAAEESTRDSINR